MAKKVTLLDVEINFEAAIKGSADLRKNIKELTDTQKELKKQGQDTTEAYASNEAQVKSLKDELRNQDTITKNLIKTNKEETGTIVKLEAKNATLRAEQRNLNLETKEGVKRNKEIVKSINENTKVISKNSDETKQARINVGNYTGSLTSISPAASQAAGAMKLFGTALKIALGPLGLIIGAIAALTAYFKRSEEGQNSLSKVMKVFGVILDNILDVVGKVGKALFNAIKKPKEAWQGFKDLLDRIGNFFSETLGKVIVGQFQIFTGNIVKGFQKLALGWQKFKDIFTDNSEKIKKAQDKLEETDKKIEDARAKRTEGLINSKNALKNAYDKVTAAGQRFIDEQKSELEIAKRLADEQANIRKDERKYLVENAKLNKESAKLRAQAEEQKLIDAEKSFELFSKSFDLDEKRLDNELKIAKRKAEAAKIEASLSKSTIEVLDNIAQLEAEVENKRAAFDETRRGRTRRLNAIRLEAFKQEKERSKAELELNKTISDEQIRNNEAILESETATYEEIQKALAENIKIKQDFIEKETELELSEIDKRLELNIINLEDAELQKTAILAESAARNRELITESLKFESDAKKEQQIIDFENEYALAEENIFTKLDLEKQALELERQQEIAAAKKVGADVGKIKDKFDKADLALEKAKTQAKLALAGGFAQNIAQIFGEQTAVGKAAAIAATTISTFQGATQAFTSFSSLGPVGVVLGVAAAAAAVASGIANVKKILSVKSGLPGESGGGGSVPSVGSAVPQISAARSTVTPGVGQGIVSRTTGNDLNTQISDSIAEGVSKAEIQPTLVEDDVTVAQVEQASQNSTSVI